MASSHWHAADCERFWTRRRLGSDVVAHVHIRWRTDCSDLGHRDWASSAGSTCTSVIVVALSLLTLLYYLRWPSVPVREFNLIACPLGQSSWKTTFQTLYLNPGGREPSGQQALWPINSGLTHWVTGTRHTLVTFWQQTKSYVYCQSFGWQKSGIVSADCSKLSLLILTQCACLPYERWPKWIVTYQEEKGMQPCKPYRYATLPPAKLSLAISRWAGPMSTNRPWRGSHSGTVVPECIKDDSESQWDQWKWRENSPPLPQKPLNQWSPNLAWVMTSGTPTPVQNFVTIRSGVSAPRPRALPPAQSDSAS